MLVLRPERVTFGGVEWAGVKSVAVLRSTARAVVEHGDVGPHAVFADAPEQRTRVVVTCAMGTDDLSPPTPGAVGVLEARVGRAGVDSGRRELRASAVVMAVSYKVTGAGAERVIELEAVSADGGADPVTLVELDA